ncbi:MAG: phosphate signaling complex PhoU family protein [Planctomycetota bacterium]|jgi:phosphate uptake regulator
MLKDLIKALRRKDEIKEMSAEVGDMLDAGAWMFEQATHVLATNADWNAVADPLYERDRQINQTEQHIRQRVVTHLSVGNQADLAPCLVLMSVVKDAERIGDYCKNIFEVGKFFRGEYHHRSFSDPLEQMRQEISGLFELAKTAFLDENEDAAKSILQKVGAIIKQTDLLIQQLLSLDNEGQFPADEAVAYVLLARHYKRVAAHLSNIATSVLSPIPTMDFSSQLDEE